MITQVEEMFSAQFSMWRSILFTSLLSIPAVRGDKKKAKKRLRVTPAQRSHHFNSFRSGMMVGLAIPALASGIHMSMTCAICRIDIPITASRFPRRDKTQYPRMELTTAYLCCFSCASCLLNVGGAQYARVDKVKSQLCVHLWCVVHYRYDSL